MQRATVKGDTILYGGRSYLVDSVIGLTLTESNMSIVMRDGSVLFTDSDPVGFYSIADRCPWASRCLA